MTVTITDAIETLPAAREFVRDRASALDKAETDTRVAIAKMGELGLFAPGCHGRPLSEMVTVIEQVAAESLAAGFSAWAHRMALEYVSRGPEPVRRKYAAALESGELVGVTAMAAGMKYCAGLGDVPLVAEQVDGGIRVSGPIRWASNLYDGALIVFPARAADGGSHYIAAAPVSSDGVTVNSAPGLLALGGTASTSLEFTDVFVPEDSIISSEMCDFIADVRPSFLLLQTAFCIGSTGTSVAESAKHLGGLGEGFADEHELLAHEHDSARERLYRFADAVSTVGAQAPTARELIQLRLDGSRLAMTATRLEATLRGGAGYATSSSTNRRFREAAFLPVQSPSEGQLRWELARSN